MSDVDPTPDTGVTIGDRLAWLRGDAAQHSASALAALSALAGEPAGTLATLAGQGAALAEALAASFSELGGQLAGQQEDVGGALYTQTNPREPYLLVLSGQLDDLAVRLDYIQQVLGAHPYMDTETANIRAILLNLMNDASLTGVNPDGATGTASAGSISASGKRYLTWGELQGITVSDGSRLLTPDGTWEGYQIYIQTDAPSAVLQDSTDPAQTITNFYVNSWVSLSGSHAIMWYVGSSYRVKGYMRVPYGRPGVLLEAITAPAASYYMVVWGEGEGGSLLSPSGVNRWGARVYCYRDWTGCTLRLVSGGVVTFDAYVGTTSGGSYTVTAEGYTITGAVSAIVVYSAEPFTVAIDYP